MASIEARIGGIVARGNGRSYGDASIGTHLTVSTRRLDHVIALDDDDNILVCESGLLLSELIDVALPRGLFVPVTPGTRFVTIGGMIAADVHGKNHHGAGSFCDHLLWLDLAIGDNEVLRCSRNEYPDLFAATCGGMGLTGIIIRAAVRMLRVPSARIRQRTIRTKNLGEAMEALESALDWSYSVAWIDCLASGTAIGRSVIFLAEHALPEELPAADRAKPFARPWAKNKQVPFDFPNAALNPLGLKLFNAAYYRAQRLGERIVALDPYFYPLDSLLDWNRIYGRRGFAQYQCVLPLRTSSEGLIGLLRAISGAGRGSFLAVLKRLGAQSIGLLSFPMPGYTLALDFPVTRENLMLLDRLDAITQALGGRVYLAKDARAQPSFAENYPGIGRFRDIRRIYGLDRRFSSHLSQRLEI